MPRLIAPSGHTLDLPARHLTFGESPQCDIPLTAGYGLAPLHFEIAPGADGLSYLRDSSQGQGTAINGEPVTTTALKEGDVITAGNLVLRFTAQTAPIPTPGPSAAAPPHPAPPLVRLPSGGETVTAADAGPIDPPQEMMAPVAIGPSLLLPVRDTGKRKIHQPTPTGVRLAVAVLLVIAGAAFCATDPGQRLLSPLISRVHQWNTERAPKPKPPAPPQPGTPAATMAALKAIPAAGTGPGPSIIAQTSHEKITRQLLTERTQTLIYADLRQLMPTYNLMASQQGLPSQRDMSESFRRTYGAIIDPFEQMSLLYADTKEDFLFILSSKNELNLEKIIGQPARPGKDGRATSRLYTINAGRRTLSAALYDPFTLLVGVPRAVARAIQPDTGLQLREATSMFPDTAMKRPGALIIVKRVNLPPTPSGGAPATAFETITTNLFLTTGTPSTITLRRNPDISEKAFVDAASPALKEQAAALAPSLGADPRILSNISPGEISLTVEEATVALPGGPSLISSTLENMAGTFVRSAPSMNSILQAQEAVMRFNSARATGAQTALRANSPREALELLNEGIRGGGRFAGATFVLPSDTVEIDTLSSLLAIDESVGLVYRPDQKALSSTTFALAVKARNYRNADLLILLWKHAQLKASDDETPAIAVRRILDWASTAEGKRLRTTVGLPSMTQEELNGALSHLDIIDRKLSWKPGQADYRGWLRVIHPDPSRDASRILNEYNLAVKAGAIPASATRDLRAAVSLITSGVRGRGEKAATNFLVEGLSDKEIAAATALLSLEEGVMKITATAKNIQP